MSTDATTTAMDELYKVIEGMQHGLEQSQVAKDSLALLVREREELRGRIGIVDVAVELIRDARNQ